MHMTEQDSKEFDQLVYAVALNGLMRVLLNHLWKSIQHLIIGVQTNERL